MINIFDGEWMPFKQGDFEFDRKAIGQQAGSKDIGIGMFRLKPGKKAFPFHYHYANEEAILVLEGSGTLRLGEQKKAVKQGDYIALPAGPEHAHQMINTSENDLIYLCMSTMHTPDVMGYPDSNKIGMMAGTPPGGKKDPNSVKMFFKQNDQKDYFFDES